MKIGFTPSGAHATMNVVQILSREEQLAMYEEKYRREAFARLIASGTPLVKSMRLAGYIGPTRDTAVQLLQTEGVRELIEEERQKLRELIAFDKEVALQELEFAREFAVDQENPAAVVAATIAKAKIVGLFDVDKAGKVPAKIEISWGGDEKVTIPKSSPLYESVSEVVGTGE